MKFLDISTDTKTTYRLRKSERVVFFMLNRSGSLTFDLMAPGAEAIILSLIIGTSGTQALSVTQHHVAPKTTSRFIGKNLIGGTARYSYEGHVIIDNGATLSDANQECRSLLLSNEASVSARPTLEIETNDVRCSHAATTSTLNEEALFYMATRGLDRDTARTLVVTGFVESLLAPYISLFPKELAPSQAAVRKYIKTLLSTKLTNNR